MSPPDDTVADLQRTVMSLRAELAARDSDFAERIDQQAATIDVLKIMSASPDDAQPVFDQIVRRARALCDGDSSCVFEYDGERVHLRAVAMQWGNSRAEVAASGPEGTAFIAEFPRILDTNTPRGQAIHERRMVHVRDWDQYDGTKTGAVIGVGLKSSLIIPLLLGDAVVGVITLSSKKPGGFSDSQIALLQTFAEQAVIAIGSVATWRALQQRTADLQESLDYQTAISDVLKVISRSTFDLQPVLDTLVEAAGRLCGAEQTALWHGDEAHWSFGAMYPPNVAREQENRALGTFAHRPDAPGAAMRAWGEQRVVQIEDVTQVDGYYEADIRAGMRTVLAVPLLQAGKPRGVFVLWRRHVELFTQRQIDLISIFADQALIAIENTRLLIEQREALERQTAVADVLQVINASAGVLVPVFETILERAMRLCGAASGLIDVFDGEQRNITCLLGVRDEYRAHKMANIPWRPRSGDILAAGKSRQTLDLRESESYKAGSVLTCGAVDIEGVRTLLAVPLIKETVLLGVLWVYRREVRAFADREIALLEAFAAQAAIAVENARLLGELQSRTEELASRNSDFAEQIHHQAATIDVLKAMSASPSDPQPVFDQIVGRARDLCGAANTAIYGFDGEQITLLSAIAPFDSVIFESYRRAFPMAPLPGGLLGRALLEREIAHALGDADSALLTDAARQLGVRSGVALPMLSEGKVVGAISIGKQELGGFSATQVALLQTFAEQAVIAIRSAETFRALEARTAELAARNSDFAERIDQQAATIDVLKVMSASPDDTQPVFDQIVQRAVQLCEGHSSGVWEYDGELLHFRAICNPLGNSPAQMAASGPEGAAFAARYPARPDALGLVGSVILERKMVLIRDRLMEESYKNQIPSAGLRSSLMIPLLRDGEPIGVISLSSQRPGGFSDSQIELMQTFAEQAVIAIGSVATYRALRERTAELASRNSEFAVQVAHQAATIDVLKVMSASTNDTKPVFDIILRRALELSGSNQGGLYEFDGTQLHMRSALGWDVDNEVLAAWAREFPRPPKPGDIMDRALLSRQTAHNRDQPKNSWNFRSVIVVPLLRDGVPIGTINVGNPRPNGFTQAQIELVQTFAEQAVIAIGSVATFRALQDRTAELTRSVAELQALEEVLRAVNSSLDLETVLATVINHAVPLAGAEEGLIYEFSEAEQVFVPKAAYGMSEDRVAALRERRIRIGETYLGRSAAERAPVSVDDVQADGGTPEARTLLQGIHAVLAVPLLRENTVVGGLVIRRRTEGAFAPATIALMQTFAAQSVLAIENARLFEAARRAQAASDAALADLRRTQDRLIQTEKLASLGALTAGIAHEIKNPLNFVNNFSALSVELLDELSEAIEPAPLTDGMREEVAELTTMLKSNLEKVVSHGKRADGIVKNMLLHSRESGGDRRAVDLNATVEEALNLAYHGARAEKPGFNVTLERHYDQACGNVALYPQEFTRVVLNLINNGFYAGARRKAESGDPAFEPTLTVSTEARPDAVLIRVRDNGIGMPDSVKARIFEPFYTTKPAGEGTGLGLSLSHDIIVKQHNGSIAVESREGAFTEFTVTIPRSSAGDTP
ncbi:MAG: GAF domain-containing protein [Alphaproteobacteria bacterium]|nr:GAF domain-containing protein [Alphaproteobacteria bacterium]